MNIKENKNRLLYKFGYLISGIDYYDFFKSQSDFSGINWLKSKIDDYYFYYDPNLEFTGLSIDGNHIVLLGTVINPVNVLNDYKKTAEILLQKYIKSSSDFFDYLDLLSGRFVLFLKSGNNCFVLQDATGIKTCFYHRLDDILLSSHVQLIAEIKNYEIRGRMLDFINSGDFKKQSRYFPGFLTQYDEIFMLSPNTLIDLATRKIKRFFPRENLQKGSITNVLVDDLSDLFSRQIQLLNKKNKLIVSLTGGIDSRLTLASSRTEKDDIIYFTYVYNNDRGHLKDLELAKQIAEKAGINHKILYINPDGTGKPLEGFSRNSGFIRSENQGIIARALYENLPGNRIHLKSTVSEIGEGFYIRHFPPLPDFKITMPYIFSYFYRIQKLSGLNRDAFKDFIDVTQFHNVVKYGYNYYDMFYWEHRNGCWQSLQIQDFDFCHDIFIIYNNRHILKKLLSVNIMERLECRLHYRIINNLWSEIGKIPLNSWVPVTTREKISKTLWSLFK